uniref:Mitochondrial assembly of ribosomal large subunit protein 1 n=1 Tax=Astyanax mexicanus TaxID=7994 RepID=A0A8B9LH27_ASTMX
NHSSPRSRRLNASLFTQLNKQIKLLLNNNSSFEEHIFNSIYYVCFQLYSTICFFCPAGSLSFNLDLLVSLLRQENAEDICVIKVPEEIRYTEFFIVVSGSSTRHLRAMAQYTIKVYKFLKRDSDSHVHIEGKDAEDWMCIDFGSMVVHFMLPATRETYELEKLWTLRSYDEQFSSIPNQSIPADFIYDAETK